MTEQLSRPFNPNRKANVRQHIIARMPNALQVVYDRKATPRNLSRNRDMILATNKDPEVPQGSPERPALDYVREDLERMLRGKDVLIIAYSGRNLPHGGAHFPGSEIDFKNATDKAIDALEQFRPNKFVILHKERNPAQAIAEAKALYVTGGNSSGHSANIFGYKNFDGSPIDNSKGSNKKPLQHVVRMKVADGAPYVGVSAGQMVATANVVPHIDAPSMVHIQRTRLGEVRLSIPFDGLNLLGNFGFAVQPHYDGDKNTNYGDETQNERIIQIIEKNPWLTIMGMKNNSALKVEGSKMTLIGDKDAKAYIMSMDRNEGIVTTQEVRHGQDISYLLDADRTIDVRSRLKK